MLVLFNKMQTFFLPQMSLFYIYICIFKSVDIFLCIVHRLLPPISFCKVCFSGEAGWWLSQAQVPSWLPSPISEAISALNSKSSMCSVCTLILFARILSLISLFTTSPATCWVVRRLFQFCHGDILRHSFLNSAPLISVAPFLLTCMTMPKGTTLCFLKGLKAGAFPLSLCVCHFGEYWKMAAFAKS